MAVLAGPAIGLQLLHSFHWRQRSWEDVSLGDKGVGVPRTEQWGRV